MKTMMLIKRSIMVALVAALTVAAFPLNVAYAAGQFDPPAPPVNRVPSDNRLEGIWQRMNNGYEHLGKFFDKSDDLSGRAEKMIARLKEAGESTAQLEAALKAYEDAVQAAKPVYESCNGIVTSHKGFDASGNVTDAAQAIQTIGDLGSKLTQIRDALDGKVKELVELMKSIREDHRPLPTATPAP